MYMYYQFTHNIMETHKYLPLPVGAASSPLLLSSAERQRSLNEPPVEAKREERRRVTTLHLTSCKKCKRHHGWTSGRMR